MGYNIGLFVIPAICCHGSAVAKIWDQTEEVVTI